MLVRIIYEGKARASSKIYVPKDALVRTPRETSVWVVRKDKEGIMKASKILVTPGEQKNRMIAVNPKKKKIKAGDWVVVQGNERLRPGASVQIINKMP